MVEEYPPKYDEYMDVVQQREFQEALHRKVIETKRVAFREAHVSSFCSAICCNYILALCFMFIASYPGVL